MSYHNKSYRVSFGNNLKSLILIIVFLLALIGFNIYASKRFSYYDFKTFLLSVLVLIPWVAIPIFVHIEYVICNWKAVLEVNRTQKKIKYIDTEREIVAGFDEITSIIKHQVKDTALLYGFYEYYEIHLTSEERLIITNLMARKFSIPGIETEIVYRYFPSVWWYDNVSGQ